eukprot:UC4_evm1s878
MRLIGVLEVPKYEFTTEKILFEQRFKALGQLDTPPLWSYDTYKLQYETWSQPDVTSEKLFASSSEFFRHCTGLITKVLESKKPPVEETRIELESVLKIAKMNTVAAKLMSLG